MHIITTINGFILCIRPQKPIKLLNHKLNKSLLLLNLFPISDRISNKIFNKYSSTSVLLYDITASMHPNHRTSTGLIHVRHQIHKKCDERSNHSLIVAFADEEQQPPGLYGGQDERRDADGGDEAAG